MKKDKCRNRAPVFLFNSITTKTDFWRDTVSDLVVKTLKQNTMPFNSSFCIKCELIQWCDRVRIIQEFETILSYFTIYESVLPYTYKSKPLHQQLTVFYFFIVLNNVLQIKTAKEVAYHLSKDIFWEHSFIAPFLSFYDFKV